MPYVPQPSDMVPINAYITQEERRAYLRQDKAMVGSYPLGYVVRVHHRQELALVKTDWGTSLYCWVELAPGDSQADLPREWREERAAVHLEQRHDWQQSLDMSPTRAGNGDR